MTRSVTLVGRATVPDVTAIVTCMTDAERPFLSETLQSVRNQTVPCEIIVVVLESNSWIDEVAEGFPGLRILRRPPGWPGAARNSGVEAATTEFVAFLDGDDVWLPKKTEKQVAFLKSGHRDFVDRGRPGICLRSGAPPSNAKHLDGPPRYYSPPPIRSGFGRSRGRRLVAKHLELGAQIPPL
jgi:glycosyltransferase involved in cell wall biosynthesis